MNIFWLATCFFLCFKANGWDKSVSVPHPCIANNTDSRGQVCISSCATGTNDRSMNNAQQTT